LRKQPYCYLFVVLFVSDSCSCDTFCALLRACCCCSQSHLIDPLSQRSPPSFYVMLALLDPGLVGIQPLRSVLFEALVRKIFCSFTSRFSPFLWPRFHTVGPKVPTPFLRSSHPLRLYTSASVPFLFLVTLHWYVWRWGAL